MSSIQKHKIKFLGIDAGGTFTDFVLVDNEHWRIHKVLSTPSNPANAILQGIEELGLRSSLSQGSLYIVHGSTVATNAALERKGARTVYITNKGFKDVLSIGRQARAELYTLFPKPIPPPVASDLCIEVDTRRDARGKLITALTNKSITSLVEKVRALAPEAAAINLLFSFLNDSEERRIEEALEELCFTSRSSYVLPKYKEYERGMATWLNASLGPQVARYIHSLSARLGQCPISIMQSTGGTLDIEQAASRAVNLLLSGPAGGLAAIRSISQQKKMSKIISFDMGGTSTDVALMDGDFTLTDEGTINHWPIATPMLDIVTIGAGGGSIAWIDDGKMLHVGPQSAGSAPGPACYNKGGKHPTVTDANLILGRLLPEAFLAGKMQLNPQKSHEAINQLAGSLDMDGLTLARGIIKLAEHEMIQALNKISIKKGHSPSEFVLCCFGGAGGLHVCSLAEKLGMTQAIVPVHSGVLSAAGMLTAPKQRRLTQTRICLWTSVRSSALEKAFNALEQQALFSLKKEAPSDSPITINRSVDLRYSGQSFTLNVPYDRHSDQYFIAQHTNQFGHQLSNQIELVNLCVELSIASNIVLPHLTGDGKKPEPYTHTASQGDLEPTPVYQRDSLTKAHDIDGPILITEHVSTTWVKPDWKARLDDLGNLLLIKD